jgi:thiamine biosynthesis protein ThiC
MECRGGSMMKEWLLTVEEKEPLAKAARLMEELIETVEVAEDEELVRDVEAALREVKEGRTRPPANLVKELNLEGEVQA